MSIIVTQHLQEDYERWATQIGDDPFQGPGVIGVLDVLKAHYLIIDYFHQNYAGDGVGGIGPKSVDLLFSAVGRQSTGYGASNRWTQDLDICATLFYGLVKNHAFHDANKRTALLTLLFHLWKIGKTPVVKQRDLERLAVRVASGQLSDYKHLYERFQKKDDCDILFISDFGGCAST